MTKYTSAAIPASAATPKASQITAFESRRAATAAVMAGGGWTGVGVGFTLASVVGTFGAASLAVGLGAAAIGGLGLVKLGTACKHLLRFGSRKAASGFLGAGALGTMVAAWPILTAVRLAGFWQVPGEVLQVLGATTLALTLFVLFHVLRVVINWMMGKGGR